MGAEPWGRAQSGEARTDCLKAGEGEERRRGGAGDGGRVRGSGRRGKEGQRLQDKGYRRGRGRVQDVRHGGDAAAPRSRGSVRGWGRVYAGAGGGESSRPSLPLPSLLRTPRWEGAGLLRLLPGCCLSFLLPQQLRRLRSDPQAAGGRESVSGGERAGSGQRRRSAAGAQGAALRAAPEQRRPVQAGRWGWGWGAPRGRASRTPSPTPGCLAPCARSTGARGAGRRRVGAAGGKLAASPGGRGRATGAGLGTQRQAGARGPHAAETLRDEVRELRCIDLRGPRAQPARCAALRRRAAPPPSQLRPAGVIAWPASTGKGRLLVGFWGTAQGPSVPCYQRLVEKMDT